MIGSAGKYVAPNGWFEVNVPLGWTLRDGADLLQIESPTGLAAVVVSLFVRKTAGEPDADIHVKRFLASRKIRGKAKLVVNTADRAAADFTEQDGKRWRVSFVSSQRALILATCTYSPNCRRDAEVGKAVLDSLEMRGGGTSVNKRGRRA